MSIKNANVLLAAMKSSGLIPVFNHKDPETAITVMKTAKEAGLQVFEFTNRGVHSLEVFKEMKAIAKEWSDFYLGIGTILDITSAEAYYTAGADFFVSPIWSQGLCDWMMRQKVIWIPGCGTVSEVYEASNQGAVLIKAFPGNVLGPAFISAIKSVLPDVLLMPTGGVEPTQENLKSWFSAGVHCVGMGSQLFDQRSIASKDYDGLKNKIIVVKKTIAQVEHP
ncbi:bifunctional 4-hydroxy-2-oxoglutarate aldolase/2-dehydro-3-deoxy-phosphogluconate aldolase [Penaeicola halotolerans]|uniref:bifunctional 4-hydroxy-2-oxoglutarate aldolase/2-dehydro-3-deoxy-phosphogluconate aldolase n=1 Tax=Penaeicola halotolerans TaxID=2793196 RepID=UPI001CF84EEE|nr:bifunctional 4-hydroxy-2-oxoglutarate aldolase/2-dehydro-3-deoxy-phosphogluconate aldolase [Penaeicola halotolerans]